MKKKARRILTIALAAVFTLCCAVFALQLIGYMKGSSVYDQAAQLAFSAPAESNSHTSAPAAAPAATPSPAPSSAPEADEPAPDEEAEPVSPVESVYEPNFDAFAGINLEALQQVNQQVLGWITIPGTTISYPMVQGEENGYYLKHTWNKTRSSVGSIFLDYRTSRDLSGFNSVIYGHKMKNGSMFAPLKNYSSGEYLSEHPGIYIADSSGMYRYDIFAVYEADVTGHTYAFTFGDDESRQEFIDASLSQSLIDTGIIPTVQDRIITLSTCTGTGYSTRWVVQAVLRNFLPA